jgi:hypothetical protein
LTEKEVSEKMNIYITEFHGIQKSRNRKKYIAYLKNAITMAVGFRHNAFLSLIQKNELYKHFTISTQVLLHH